MKKRYLLAIFFLTAMCINISNVTATQYSIRYIASESYTSGSYVSGSISDTRSWDDIVYRSKSTESGFNRYVQVLFIFNTFEVLHHINFVALMTNTNEAFISYRVIYHDDTASNWVMVQHGYVSLYAGQDYTTTYIKGVEIKGMTIFWDNFNLDVDYVAGFIPRL